MNIQGYGNEPRLLVSGGLERVVTVRSSDRDQGGRDGDKVSVRRITT